MYNSDPSGKRIYTLQKVMDARVTKSAHPARFSPDDKWSRHRVTMRKRYGVLLEAYKESELSCLLRFKCMFGLLTLDFTRTSERRDSVLRLLRERIERLRWDSNGLHNMAPLARFRGLRADLFGCSGGPWQTRTCGGSVAIDAPRRGQRGTMASRSTSRTVCFKAFRYKRCFAWRDKAVIPGYYQ